ncbi:PorT family protein [Hymenobacter busanensis]|uniref:PorT family protein n=1 Tax=Hymenobacter busanensis TaxID=2607656 RepID=A0A7L4ZZS0_9BACT|nr:porin family protein [Hymenobacter busanensis]KAA9331607.1 PorT family protein [Hymenobacter busanensis]QHJ08758.1 outer membrane beta-barrel protein [Hymenobacter busanensis]
MKKTTVLLLLATAGGSSAVHAQTSVGIKVGANLATAAGTNVSEVGNIVTPHGGLTFNVPITQDATFSVHPELLYSQKGYKLKYINNSYLTTRLHYVDVPVLARMDADGLIFEAGPQVGFLAAASTEQPLGLGEKTKVTGTDGLKRLDVGYVAGVGFQTGLGPNFGLRYNGGLTKPSLGRNSVFQLYVGYQFPGR